MKRRLGQAALAYVGVGLAWATAGIRSGAYTPWTYPQIAVLVLAWPAEVVEAVLGAVYEDEGEDDDTGVPDPALDEPWWNP